MAKKGKIKNGVNKAKHTRLLTKKKNKIKLQKELNRVRLKELNAKINQEKA